jgi:hypothetical protein
MIAAYNYSIKENTHRHTHKQNIAGKNCSVLIMENACIFYKVLLSSLGSSLLSSALHASFFSK